MTPQERRAQRRMMREQERQAREARRHPGTRRAPQQRDDATVAEQTAMNDTLDALLGRGNGPRLDTDGIRGSSTNGIQAMLASIAQHHGFQGTPAEQMQQLQRHINSPEGQAYMQAHPENRTNLLQNMGALAQQRQGRGFMPGWQGQAPDPAAPQTQPRDPKAAGVLQAPVASQPAAPVGLDGSLAPNIVLPASPVESQVAPRSPQGLAPNS